MGDEFDFGSWGTGDGEFGGGDDFGTGNFGFDWGYGDGDFGGGDVFDMSDEELMNLINSNESEYGPVIPGSDVGPSPYGPGDNESIYGPTIPGGGGSIGGGGGSSGWMGNLLSSLGLGNLTAAQLAALGLSIPALGSIFGDPGDPGSTTVTQELPPWYTDAAKGAIGDALYLPDYESFMQMPGALLSEADLAPYMNNYIDATLNPQLVRMGEDFAREGNQLDASAVKTGAFGGSRNVLEQSLAQERQNKRVDEATSNAYSQAFNSAMNLAGQDRGVIYQDFMNQFQNPYMQQDALNKTLGSVRPGASTTQTGTAPESNPWDKLLGLGLTGWGMAFPNGLQQQQNT